MTTRQLVEHVERAGYRHGVFTLPDGRMAEGWFRPAGRKPADFLPHVLEAYYATFRPEPYEPRGW